jgi:hypothetical protein
LSRAVKFEIKWRFVWCWHKIEFIFCWSYFKSNTASYENVFDAWPAGSCTVTEPRRKSISTILKWQNEHVHVMKISIFTSQKSNFIVPFVVITGFCWVQWTASNNHSNTLGLIAGSRHFGIKLAQSWF